MGKRHHVRRVVNAMDYLHIPLASLPSEATSLPEFPCDNMDMMKSPEPCPAGPISEFLRLAGADPWPAIRKHLTARQFQAFELFYRYQMSVNDIMAIMGIKRQTVHHDLLEKARQKLRKAFAGKKKK